ncbi:MAG: PAS domain S-box protein [Proteobacteria bacterium]|nr:PAS domain S-box protein [Pseudomonadota bacterium]
MTPAGVPSASFATLQGCFAIAPDAMLAVDAEGTIVLANLQAESMFGYPAGTLQGMALDVLVPEPLRHAHRKHRDDYLRRPRTRPMGIGTELLGVRRDGREFQVEIGLSPVATEQGLITIASVRDISETRRVQQAMERTRRDTFVMQIGRLALESRDYERAIQRIPELVCTALDVPAVAILSTDWHRSDLRVRAFTGLSAQAAETLAATFGETRFVRSTFAAGGPDAVTLETLRGGQHATIRANLAAAGFHDVAMVPLFGRDEPLGALVALAYAPAGFDRDKVGFLQSVATLLSATVERSRSEEQLAHAQRLDAIGQLTGGIAHDFNNLLTVVSGNLQLLEMELSAQPQAQEAIDSALRAVDRGADLTRRLLAFARRQPLRPRAIVPQPLLEELGHMLRRTLGEAVAVDVDCATAVPDVYADPNELDTALVNLALNARDAMPRGGRLAITAREIELANADNEWKLPRGQYVAIDVADSGTGMPPEVQAHALEPFFTTKVSGKGSGLGLSMVYGFVTQSGGAMAMDSRLGYGTRVTLVLPVADNEPGSRRELPQAAHSAEPPRHATILVVEDETDVRTIATRFLRAIGYDVIAVADAREALDTLRAQPAVDLLFSDVVLGSGMNGVELAREARRSRPGLAVLLTSGYPGAEDRQAADNRLDGFELLRKPYRREQLVSAIQRVLEGG